MTEQATLIAEQ